MNHKLHLHMFHTTCNRYRIHQVLFLHQGKLEEEEAEAQEEAEAEAQEAGELVAMLESPH
jgi:hypothetical protein